ncbi:hypothetical protein K449DRAFT_453598 [Hypoxylon sp. EC38]|nr:hypothetical protein K449DRAFT_453598 [Hypoxylon sp. EC38]
MCNWLSLEICCCQPEHHFPYTLKVCQCMVLCESIARDFKLDVAVNGGVVRPAEDFGNRCRNFDEKYLRCERIFWSSCNDCTRQIALNMPEHEEDDILMYQEFQRLLRQDLTTALENRLYKDLVQAFAPEFNITERFVLNGSRWVKAPKPTKEDPLGPNPPYDSKLDGLKWWLEQGFGGQVHNQLWKRFCGDNYPADPFGQSIRDWAVPLSSSARDYASVGTRAASNFASPAAFSPNEEFGGHNSWQDFMESYDWYPRSTDEEDSDET